MTTMYPRDIECACCGHRFDTMAIGSTNAFGSMDLDMRPPPMQRDTLAHDIEECPQCHACLPRADTLPVGVNAAWVREAAYLRLATDRKTPETPRRFLAYAHLAERAADGRAAAWAYRCAAWAFDDLGESHSSRASECRDGALGAIKRLHASDATFADDRATDEILCLDLLRRAGHFDEAGAAAKSLMTRVDVDVLRNIAMFQAERSEARDSACYQVSHALP